MNFLRNIPKIISKIPKVEPIIVAMFTNIIDGNAYIIKIAPPKVISIALIRQCPRLRPGGGLAPGRSPASARGPDPKAAL